MIKCNTPQFRTIKKQGNVPDLNNVVHVAGFLAAAHLKGAGFGKGTGTGAHAMWKGVDAPDGSGIYPSYYYVNMGGKFNANC